MLAVIVLNWNGGDDTLACLKSVYESDYGGELVVYVPDNGSTDGSLDRVRGAYPQARVIENGGNLGFAGGNNPGWRAAVRDGARWVFFLNNDAAVAPDCLRRMVEVCEANPKIGAASPRIFYGAAPTPDEPGRGLDRGVWFEKGLVVLDRVGAHNHISASPEELASEWYESDLATGCALLVRGETLERTGGFDETLFAYYEDVDLSLKIRELDLVCAIVPAAHAWHKVSRSTGGAMSPTSVFYIARNGHLVARRHAAKHQAWGAYRRRFPIEALRFVGNRVSDRNLEVGAAGLQGILCALTNQTGIRPSRKPGIGYHALAWVIHKPVRFAGFFKRTLSRT
jgi:GT2 family glycosyltransferase